MGVNDTFTGYGTQKVFRVVAVVDAIDMNVVDVYQQAAVGLLQHGIEEVDLFHFFAGCCVIGNVFNGDALFQNVLNPADARCHIIHRFTCEGNGH